MATEYKLSYTASDINAKLKKIDDIDSMLIYKQNEEPVNAEENALWIDLNEVKPVLKIKRNGVWEEISGGVDDNDVVLVPVQPDWNETDETSLSYIKNKPEIATDDEIIEMLAQEDVLPVVADADGGILADENENILLW